MAESASTAASRATDAAARLEAQTVFHRPVVLEAGAGTGKTTTLVARLLAWCLGPGWARALAELRAGPGTDAEAWAEDRIAARVLSGVSAMTFTDAAAAEMAVRFGEALVDVEGGARPVWVDTAAWPDEALVPPRARALLGNLERLEVRTIHSFCRRLLARSPLAAGLHPAFDVDADQDQLPEVVTEVVEELLGAAYATEDADALGLAALGLGPHELESALAALAGQGTPAAALKADPFPPAQVDALRSGLATALDGFFDAGGGALETASRSKTSTTTVLFLRALQTQLPAVEGSGAALLLALIALLDQLDEGGARKRLAEWARGRFNKGETAAVEGIEDEVVRASAAVYARVGGLGRVDPVRLAPLCRLLAPMLAEVHARLEARGILTFSALLVRAEALLRDRPDVASQERRRLRQLLVDEFQDTDPRQCSLVRALALEGPADERPGLFIVGDPKQSIYGWRAADLRAYERFLDEVRAEGGVVSPLSVNFRSVPAILDEVERLVAPVMIRAPELQPAFEPLLPSPTNLTAPGFTHDRWAPVEHWHAVPHSGGGRIRADNWRPIEAAAVAQDIATLHAQHGVKWGEVALLFRASTALPDFVDALRDAGVPYRVEKDKSYFQRREVIDAASLVRWVADPTDHVAMLGWLRSPVLGVPDAALLPLWRAGLPGLLTRLRGPDDPVLAEVLAAIEAAAVACPSGAEVPGAHRLSGWPVALADGVRGLAQARLDLAELPADQFVQRLRDRFLFEGTEAARYQGHYRVANVDRFFRELTVVLCDPDHPGDVHLALRRLREAVGDQQAQTEARPKDGADDAVALMTIHKAKGLDFPHTYVVQVDRGPGRRPDSSRTTAVPTHDGWALSILGAQNLGLADVDESAEAVTAAERVRTLYVAATRAKVRLVLTGNLAADAKPLDQCDSYSKLMQHREGGLPVGLLLPLLPPAPDDEGGPRELPTPPWVDHSGARFIAAVRLLDDSAVHRAEIQALPTPTGFDELEAHQAAAALRMARPRTAAAAAESHARLHASFEEPDEDTGRVTEPTVADPALAPVVDEDLPGLPPTPGLTESQRQHVAMAAGSAVHLVLERFALDTADAVAELARQRQQVAADIAALVPAGLVPHAVARAEAVIDRLSGGRLLGQLLALGPLDEAGGVVGREVPLLLPAEGDTGPVGYRAGAIDLLYQDRDTGGLVVADFKTDWLSGPALAARAEVYADQGRTYARAVQRGLGLPIPPRVELWFVAADRVVIVA